jgi:hypothetical protein
MTSTKSRQVNVPHCGIFRLKLLQQNRDKLMYRTVVTLLVQFRVCAEGTPGVAETLV